jgi:hypothetical protein
MTARDPAAATERRPAPAQELDRARGTVRRHPRLALGVALTLLAVLCLILTQAVDFEFFQLRIRLLDSDSHASLFVVASLAAQALAALAAAGRSRARHRSTGWIALAILTTLLLVVRVGVSFRPALLLGPVAVVFVLIWYLTSSDPKPARTVVRAGLAALAFSYVVHAFGPHVVAALGYAGNTWPYQVKGMLKHSAELAGWMLVAVGIQEAVER